MSQAMHRALLGIGFESVGKWRLDESGKHPVNEQDEGTTSGGIRELYVRHSGASRSDEPGISRFRVRIFDAPRNDSERDTAASSSLRGARDEAIHLSIMPRHGLLRFARNDG
jgi:hypothetical protein